LSAITNTNLATLDHVAVQGKLAIKFPNDFFEHPAVSLLSVWIERGHDAPHPEVFYSDDNVPDAQNLARPRTFSQSFYACDDDVGSEPSAVMTEVSDGVIGGSSSGSTSNRWSEVS
jgi:hypothetical protein